MQTIINKKILSIKLQYSTCILNVKDYYKSINNDKIPTKY